MQLISDIINELVDSSKSITSPLLKTKVLASRLKSSELLTWTNNELNGYQTSSSLPEYRRCGCNISGTYINGNMQVNDQALPTHGLPEDLEEQMKNMEFYQSVATLESMESVNKSGQLEAIFPAELTALIEYNIQKKGNPFFQLVKARKSVSVAIVTQILSVIRSKLLDFMLKLDEEFGNITAIEELQKNNTRISTIMNQTIINNTGDGNIVNTGDNANIEAKITIKKGDKEALQKKLHEFGVQPADTKELISIIDSETPDKKTKTFGSKVNGWVQKMLGKALDGSWQIGIGTAGNILADTIQSYYGLK